MATNIKSLVKQIDTAARAYDAAEIITVSEKLVEQIRKNIVTHPEGFTRELAEAVGSFDRSRAEELCSELVAHLRSRAKPYPFAESKKILATLRRKRYFDLMGKVADVLIQTGQDQANIRRQYAQALLDQGYISAALDMLQVLEQDCLDKKDEDELAEARGLMGRARKQIYMNATAKRANAALRQNLKQAVSAYTGVYKKEPKHIWHGVNAVSLLERAKHDKVALAKSLPDATTIAEDILKQISSKKNAGLWDFASAGEASLALQDYPQALKWIIKYTQENPDADAFEYASTLRQFQEVWKLDEVNTEHAKILHLLRTALLQKEGGRVEIDNTEQSLATVAALEADKQFEQVLGKDRYKTFQWYRTGLERATGVAQVLDRSGNAQGSGFLVRGTDIHESLGEDWVVVTNAHVISDDLAEQSARPAALPADEARIRFEAKDPNLRFKVEEILFSSPRNELDCSIVSLQSPVEHKTPYPIARRLPLVNKNQRVYIIGHPKGSGLSYSIDDNLLLDHEKPRIHYRAPTEGGSSGSPVFNQQWDLLALHHAGGMKMEKLNNKPGTYPANEGLSFQSIRDAVAARLG